MKPHLYINSKGYYVTRHSYSGSDSFNYCARKYYLERVQGWTERDENAAKFFGIAVEQAVQFYHQHGMDVATAVAEFHRRWDEAKDKPYKYNKSDLDWNRLNLTGEEMVKLYAIKYPTFPYVVTNPQDSFQVETNFEVFPGTKLAGLEFTSYIDIVAQIKDTFEPLIIDEKTSGKDVPEYSVLDPQLRSYAWVKGWPNAAFVWYRKCGRTISKGDTVTFLEPYGGFQPGAEAIVMGRDILGNLMVTQSQRMVDEMDARFVGESKAVKADRLGFIETNAKAVPERVVTKQQVLFKMVVITPESAEDIGRAIKRDIIAIVQATEKDFFPMQSGVRYPNEKCPNCPMRGICANKPELRDMLLARKQVDELEFGKESE
jgi:CRISPR/Cas system-associated exonuclease Cas4 (RecB family)